MSALFAAILLSAKLAACVGVDSTPELSLVQMTKMALGPTRTSAGSSRTDKTVVWVTGYPRSGTSTMLSMASSGFAEAPGRAFSLFEPCHNGDQYEKDLSTKGCSGLVEQLANCDFTGVRNLWGWTNPHSSNNGTKFSAGGAADLCQAADIVSFKTVDYGHHLKSWLWLLEANPQMHIITAVRDPRGIYASWKTTEPFSTLIKGGKFYTIGEICESFASNLEVQHPRVKSLVFEALVEEPATKMQEVYDFLGVPFGEAQQHWIDHTFDAADCPPVPEWFKGFDDCHKDSKKASEKWQHVLSEEELNTFNLNPHCRRVVEAYGFPPADTSFLKSQETVAFDPRRASLAEAIREQVEAEKQAEVSSDHDAFALVEEGPPGRRSQ